MAGELGHPDPDDIIRTYGTESNVKEIYDACNELAQDRENIILNQFREFGNYIIHRAVWDPPWKPCSMPCGAKETLGPGPLSRRRGRGEL